MSANSTYKRRKANHECTYCGAKLPDDYKFFKCEKCLKSDNEMAKYARKMALKAGLCTICKTRKARQGMTTCELCGRKKSDQIMTRRKRLKEQGLCTMCGKVPHAENSCLCDECRIKWRMYSSGYNTVGKEVQYDKIR